jgi:dephospho-CoA kinase
MYLIGLTGSIATGKTTVSRFLSHYPLAIVDADLIAKEVVRPDSPGFYRVAKAFPECIIKHQNEIDRALLAEKIFSQPELRQKLNRLLHPLIQLEILKQILYHFISGQSICILDVPLLYETKMHHFCYATMVVYCSPDEELQRLMKRNAYTKEEALNRIQSQMSIEDKKALATIVIDNSYSVDDTKKQIHDWYSKVSPAWMLWRIMFLFPAIMLFLMISIWQNVQRWLYWVMDTPVLPKPPAPRSVASRS